MKRGGRKAKKSFAEERLLSDLERAGCPICRETAGSDRRYFFWFFHEQYQFPHTLDHLTASLGFCRDHAALLGRDLGRSSQLAFVHEILVRRILRTLTGGASGRPSDRRGAAGAGPAASLPCPACQEQEKNAASAAFWLARLLDDPRPADRYGRPGMLCLPHLRITAPLLSATALRRLLSLHESALASALAALPPVTDEPGRLPPEGGEEELMDALRPALRLSAGHDRGAGAFPPAAEAPPPARRRDPVEEFLEGLRRPGVCAVCLEVRRAWLEWLGYLEEAAPRGWEMKDLLPLDRRHIWPTIHHGGKLLQAATARNALEAALGRVSTALSSGASPEAPEGGRRPFPFFRALSKRRGPRRMRAILARPPWCPVGRRLEEAQDRALALLFALLQERRHRSSMEEGGGLCLRHFSRAMGLGPPSRVREVLCEIETVKLSLLHWELMEALRKRSWSTRPEADGTETSSWRRALWKFSGSFEKAEEE